MIGINKAILVGNLGADPDFKEANGHNALCKFSVATSRRYTTRDGEQKEHTEWHKVAVWGKHAENCNKYLSKGSKVYVEGRMETREYNNKDGEKRYWHEINAFVVTFLDSKPRPGGTFTDMDASHPAERAEAEDLPF